jgi:DNA (cytosine-5)-methyltransferase 1
MRKSKKVDRTIPPVDVAKHVQKLIDSFDFTKFDYYAVDLFCGFGGVTFGLQKAKVNGKKLVKILACINHDWGAIQSHKKNHPGAIHMTEDIRAAKLEQLTRLVNHIRKVNPNAKIVLWASVECTNFSKAKGGMSRKADSRTLAGALFRYVRALRPDMLWMENVVEFLLWGPLMEKVIKGKGKDGDSCPIEYDKKEKAHFPVWIPVPDKKEIYYKRFVSLMQRLGGYSYEHAKLNAADYGAPTSRERLFIQFNSPGMVTTWPEATHVKEPLKYKGVAKIKKHVPVKKVLKLNEHGDSIFARKKALCANTHHRIYNGLVAQVGGGKKIVEQFIDNYYGNGFASSIDSTCPTLRTHCSKTLLTPYIYRDFTSGGDNQSIHKPAGSLPTVPKMSLVTPTPWIMDTQFNNVGIGIEQPMKTLVAARKQFYLMNPQWGFNGNRSIDKPCFTLIARMDKMPPHLVEVEAGKFAIIINEHDDEWMVKIKMFCAAYGIADIKMRPLFIDEKLQIQGLPADYKMVGNQTEQNKWIGNCVPPAVPRSMIEAHALHNDVLQYANAA